MRFFFVLSAFNVLYGYFIVPYHFSALERIKISFSDFLRVYARV